MNDSWKHSVQEAKHKKAHTVWHHLCDMSEKSKLLDMEKLVAAWGWQWELTLSSHEESSWGDENVLEQSDGGGGISKNDMLGMGGFHMKKYLNKAFKKSLL